ncbi:MAG: GNAT family N-acetyltransferase [Pseudomonadota bacterium]
MARGGPFSEADANALFALHTNRRVLRYWDSPPWADPARAQRFIAMCGMGYCLDDAAWGQGFGTEAAGALLQWAFDTLDLNRVQAETDTRNTASARVLEKLRFAREGTLREDCVVEGEVSDTWVYGLLRRQWQPRHSPSAAG